MNDTVKEWISKAEESFDMATRIRKKLRGLLDI
jgi:hypothetical protein